MKLRVDIRGGLSSQPHMELEAPIQPMSVGTAGEWAIQGDGVAPIHGYLYFDGQSLYAAQGGGAAPVVDGRAAGAEWMPVPVPGTIKLGQVTLAVEYPAAHNAPQAAAEHLPAMTPPRGVSYEDEADEATIVVNPEEAYAALGARHTVTDEDDQKAVGFDGHQEDEATRVALPPSENEEQTDAGAPRPAAGFPTPGGFAPGLVAPPPGTAPPGPPLPGGPPGPPRPPAPSFDGQREEEATQYAPLEMPAGGTGPAPGAPPMPGMAGLPAGAPAPGMSPPGMPAPPMPPPGGPPGGLQALAPGRPGDPTIAPQDAKALKAPGTPHPVLKAWNDASIPQRAILVLLPFALVAVLFVFNDDAPTVDEGAAAPSDSAAASADPDATPDEGVADDDGTPEQGETAAEGPSGDGDGDGAPPAGAEADAAAPKVADSRSKDQLTLEREAADLVAAGDFSAASAKYRILAKEAPDHPAFSVAARILKEKARR